MPAVLRPCACRPLSARLAVLVAVAALLGSGCSSADDGDGGLGGADVASTCTLVGRLAAAGEDLAEADLSDPDAFSGALDAAVLDYVTTLDSLMESVPDDLVDDLEELRGLVEQYRFEEAMEARAPLDGYVDEVCPATVTTTVGDETDDGSDATPTPSEPTG